MAHSDYKGVDYYNLDDIFTEEEKAIRDTVRDFVNNEILPIIEKYNQEMPANPNLKPLDIAQITTYLYNIWDMKEGVITASEIEDYLKTKPENY